MEFSSPGSEVPRHGVNHDQDRHYPRRHKPLYFGFNEGGLVTITKRRWYLRNEDIKRFIIDMIPDTPTFEPTGKAVLPFTSDNDN